MAKSGLSSTGGLVDACAEAFVLLSGLRSAGEPASAEALRSPIHEVLERLGTRARQSGVDSKHIDEARYALCALIDETVLNSPWEAVKGEWIGKPLQMELYGSFTAGEQFYTRLEALRGSSAPEDVDVLEVYAQCLALGFRGKYADFAGMQTIASLLDKVCGEIRRARGNSDNLLSAPWSNDERLPQRIRRLPVWGAPAIGAALVLVLLWVLDGVLASQAATLLMDVAGAGR